MKRPKITIVGSGHVGATLTFICASKALADLVLVDIAEGIPQGLALDIQQSLAIDGSHATVTGTNSYEETSGSDLIVITAGSPRKPGMSRDDLLSINTKIVADVTQKCMERSPKAILIIVTNPLDAMVYVAHKLSGLARNRVFGMSGVLDTARYKTFLAQALSCSTSDITAYVLGGHGDTMVPVPQHTLVKGTPVTKLLSQPVLNGIIERTRNGGAEIVKYLKTGSAYYAPAASTAEMIDAIVNDRKKTLPACCILEGEYGTRGVAVGVPAVLGRSGIEKVIEIDLDNETRAALNQSVEATQKLVASIKL